MVPTSGGGAAGRLAAAPSYTGGTSKHGAAVAGETAVETLSTARPRAAGVAPAKACGAKTRKGTPCPNPAMANGKCRMHGGLTPSGPAAPTFKHGGDLRPTSAAALGSLYSGRYRPNERYTERYEASLADLNQI